MYVQITSCYVQCKVTLKPYYRYVALCWVCQCVKWFNVWTFNWVLNSCYHYELWVNRSQAMQCSTCMLLCIGVRVQGMRVTVGMRRQQILKSADSCWDDRCFSSPPIPAFCSCWLTAEKWWDMLRCLIACCRSDVLAEAAQPQLSSSHHSF